MRFINALVACSVIAITSSSVLAQSTAVQWTVASGGNGHWYQCLRTTGFGEVWNVSQAAANVLGGHLATLTSQQENSWAYELSVAQNAWSGRVGPLLGGYKLPNNSFRWVTDEPWSYTSWLSGEPSSGLWEPYLSFLGPQDTSSSGATWNDTDAINHSGDPTYTYIVEWSADCNSDGIVDYGQCLNGTLPDYNGNNIPDCCERGEVCVTGNYPVQWRVADGGNGHWYQLRIRSSVVPWSSAATESVASAGHLASILSEAEDIFTFNVANHPGAWQGYLGPWLGGRQVPGTGEPLGIWEWSSGEPWGYVGPDSSFPNNGGPPGTDENRLHYIDFVRKWNDIPENGCPENGGGVRAMIVEWEADCNNDGVVDYGQILSGQLIDANGNNTPDCCEQVTNCDQLAVGLQAHYLLDGNCLDASGYDRNGAAAGIGYVAGPLGLAGTAASFDGSSSFIQVDGVPIPTDNAFTWALWLRADGLGTSYAYIIERIAGIGNNLLSPGLSVRSNGSLVFGSCCTAGGSETNTPANTVSLGVWAHVACTSSIAGVRRIYVNGALAGEGFAVDYGQQLPKILIGRDRLDCCDRFRGAIDDLRFYSRPLSATEVATLHAPTAPCPGDISGNNKVDGVDLSVLLGVWGTDGSGGEFDADVTNDGIVNGADLTIILGGWGPCPN